MQRLDYNLKKAYLNTSLHDPVSWKHFDPEPNSIWKRTFDLNDCDFELNIDNDNFFSVKPKILFLIEPEEIIKPIYKNIFDKNPEYMIITHHKKYVNNKNIFYINPPTDTWIDKNKLDIYTKTKLCSMISSTKNFAVGHKLRLDIIKTYFSKIDLYGREINPIENKIEGLKDYCFSFAIENSKEPGYYTEKVFDCFLTGTIPIYWGDPNISDIFDKNGIIVYDDNFVYENLSYSLYESKKQSVLNNFNIAKNLIKSNHINFYFMEGIKKLYESL